jgi:hypothetical protein
MTKSDSIASLSKALSTFQAEVKNVTKDGKNPFFKSKYATLDAIWDAVRPLLGKHGLALTQFPSGDNELESILLHESGEWIASTLKLQVKDATAQGQGSAITYGRRYMMSAILGIATEEDDDGNAATTKPAAKAAPQRYSSNTYEPF